MSPPNKMRTIGGVRGAGEGEMFSVQSIGAKKDGENERFFVGKVFLKSKKTLARPTHRHTKAQSLTKIFPGLSNNLRNIREV
jgi:hypothetical protein